MTFSTHALIDWGYTYLNLNDITLSVYSDNEKAIQFYERIGFLKTFQKPLYEVNLGDEIKWEIAPQDYKGPVRKYYLYMKQILWLL